MDDLLHLANQLADQPATPLIAPVQGRVAYMVSHGQSYASNGYAIRTQGIAQALNQHGFETLCFVRPGRPWELNGEDLNVAPETVVKGVRYLHSAWPQGVAPAEEDAHLEASVERFVELFRVYRPAIVLAATNYTVGLPAWIAAKRLGLPFYNEVRGFWELSRDAREPGYAGTPVGKREAKRDAFVASQAQRVFTLNQPMQEELGRRGLDVNRVEIVPNGMNALPEIKPTDPALKERLGIGDDDRVVGYVGSIAPHEGLDTLIDACAELVGQGEKLKLLIVGDDQPITGVVGRSSEHAERPWLMQVGRVAYDEVANYYALIDTVVIPRKQLPVCELVPPIKAAEALAYGKRLAVSDIAPLKEYVVKRDGVVTFAPEHPASLAAALQGSLKLPAPKLTTELLFAKHTEPMVRALKGEQGQQGGKSEPVVKLVAAPAVKPAPGGLSKAVFGPRVPDPAIKRKLGIAENEKVIGIFNTDDSLDDLLDASSKLVKSGERIKVLLMGGGQPSIEASAGIRGGSDWLIHVGLVPDEQVADYYSILDLVITLRGNEGGGRLDQADELITAAHYNLPLLTPEHCYADVSDYLANVIFYQEGRLQETIKNILPYTECGKYQDDRSVFYRLVGHLDPAVEPQSQENDRIAELVRVLADAEGDKISLEEEKKVRADIDSEQSRGRISNALALSKILYENTGSFYSFKIYVKSLFFAQKYDHVVRLCEGRDSVGSELEVIRKKSKSYLSLFEKYYNYCQGGNGETNFSPDLKKSVYFLHSSLPYFSGGYATRAHGLASALVDKGLDVRAYTRPNFPYDVKKDISERVGSVKVDEITYWKTACRSVRTRDEASYMLDCVEVFDGVIKKERPGYIHGRSTYQISLPALIAAKKNNLPFVYEVSGLWEIVHESRETAPQRKNETEKIRHLETMVAKEADLVFTLTGAMKDELIARGVDGSKITILPNCTNPDKFLPRLKSKSLLSELGVSQDTPVIGYIGSFQDYEGLDDLIVACEILSDRQPDLDYRLLLVGDGPYYKQICEQAESSSVKDKIIITGRVPHSLASEYYSVVDIAPFPRKSWPVCEMVSPMKPLEALAMEKAVLVSSVKALSEMVVDGETGVVFEKASCLSLAQTLSNLIADPAKRVRLGKSARSWVIKNRTWNEISDMFESRIFI